MEKTVFSLNYDVLIGHPKMNFDLYFTHIKNSFKCKIWSSHFLEENKGHNPHGFGLGAKV